MDIDLLSKMVKELILDNDRVVLPGLGSFVAEIVPSTFSDKGYTIHPPYRRMYFRSKPNEGKELAELYAKGNNVELAVAERIIADFVSELKSILYTRKAVAFPGLGRLRATKENNVFFVADENLDIYPAGFGLEPISLKTHQETREEVAAAVGGLKSLLREPEPPVVQEIVDAPKEEQPPLVQETVDVPKEEQPAEEEPEYIIVPLDEAGELQDTEEPQEEEELRKTDEEELPDVIEEVLPEAEEEPAVRTGEAVSVRRTSDVRKVLVTICGTIIAIVLLLLAVLAIVGRTNPELVDRFLYTPEELKILNQIL